MTATSDVNRDRIAATEAVIRPHVRRTPIVEVDLADFGLPAAPVTLKLELLQHAGSFKTRGAFANLLTRAGARGRRRRRVGRQSRRRRRLRGACGSACPRRIFVPTSPRRPRSSASAATAPTSWSAATAMPTRWPPARRWIAADRRAAGARLRPGRDAARPGHASALELEQQAPDLDTLLVAVGGGGLIGGIAAWYARPSRVVGVEPRAAPTLTQALAAGRPVDAPAGGIAADSLAPRRVGELMFPIARATSSASCWSATTPSARRRTRCGSLRSSPSPAARPRSPRCCPAVSAGARRARRRPRLRRQHDGGELRPLIV